MSSDNAASVNVQDNFSFISTTITKTTHFMKFKLSFMSKDGYATDGCLRVKKIFFSVFRFLNEEDYSSFIPVL